MAAHLPYHRRRTGGRVVEGTALEMRRRCKPTVGSNPTLSANPTRFIAGFQGFVAPAEIWLGRLISSPCRFRGDSDHEPDLAGAPAQLYHRFTSGTGHSQE